MPLDLSFFLPNKHPEKRITITNLLQTYYIYYYSIWKFLVLWVSLENKRLFFNLLFGCTKVNFDLDVLNKKLYAENDTTAPNLATDATVVFKLNHIYNSD